MSGKNDLATYSNLCRIYLEWFGVWPSENKKLSNILFSISMTTIIFSIALPQVTKLIKVWGNLDHMSKLISTAVIPYLITLTKLSTLFYNREKIAILYHYMTNHWKSKKSSRELDIMIEYGLYGRKFSLLCFSLGYTTLIAQMMECAFRNFSNWTNSGKCKSFSLCLEASYPHNWHNSPAFEITVFIEYIGTFLAMIAYSATDGFFSFVILHASGQFHVLRLKILNLVNHDGVDKSLDEFDTKFSIIVRGYEHINSCVELIENTYYLMFLAQLLACTIQFCFQGYMIVMYITDKNASSMLVGVLFMAMFIIYLMGNIYVYCYLAEILQKESLMLAQTAYECHWYNLPHRKAKCLLFLMQISNKPVKITAGKFCVLNLALFGSIVKTSLGYLSVLVTMRHTNN